MDKYVKAHITWTIVVLSALLIVAVTWRIPLPSHGADMIGFAATVTSMVLAVFAIFQAMNYASSATQEKRDADMSNAETRLILSEIRRQIPDISSQVQRVGEKLDQIRYSQPGFAQPPGPETQAKPGLTAQDIKTLIANSSTVGLLAMESAILSDELKKPILLNYEDPALNSYTLGFIAALAATRFLDFAYSVEGLVEIPQVSPVLADAKDEIVAAFQEREKTLPEGSTVIPGRRQMLANFGLA